VIAGRPVWPIAGQAAVDDAAGQQPEREKPEYQGDDYVVHEP
jgi:hypothetical protein